jgi:hypothetical protein
MLHAAEISTQNECVKHLHTVIPHFVYTMDVQKANTCMTSYA